jgi:Protein of unknown function (DUF938)
MGDDRQYGPARLRNRGFILDVLRDVLPTTGVILEVASGSGEHVVHCAKNLPSLVFQPFDPDPDARLSVAAWVKATGVTNVRAPFALDALHSVWPIASADGIHDPDLTMGGDYGIDQRGGRHTPFEIAALSIRSIQTGRVRNSAEQSSLRPEVVALAKWLARKKPKGGALSLRAISASLAEQGHLNQRGRPFNPKSVAVMLAARSSKLGGTVCAAREGLIQAAVIDHRKLLGVLDSLVAQHPKYQTPRSTAKIDGADEFRSGAAPCVGVCGRLAGGLRRSESQRPPTGF